MTSSNCLTQEQAKLFHKRELSPGELMTLGDHVADCVDCQLLLRSVNPTKLQTDPINLVRAATDSPREIHASFDTLERYVKGALPSAEREDLQYHVEVCSLCKARLENLMSLQDHGSFAAAPPRWNLRGFMVAVPALAAIVVASFVLGPHNQQLPTARDSGGQHHASQPDRSPAKVASNNIEPHRDPTVAIDVPQYDGAGPDIPSGPTSGPGPYVVAPSESGDQALAWRAENRPSPKQHTIVTPTETTTDILRPLDPDRSVLSGDEDTSFRVLSPFHTFALSTQPTIRWTSPAGASDEELTYKVELFKVDGATTTTVLAEDQITTLSYTPSIHLERGAIYRVQVTASNASGPVAIAPNSAQGTALFEIIPQSKLDDATALLSRQDIDPVSKALGCMRMGLLDNARDLLIRYPGDAKAAALLKKVDVLQKGKEAN